MEDKKFGSAPKRAKGTIMKNTNILVNLLIADIENKAVLEVACGAADFSVSASAYSDNVHISAIRN